jgi:cytochrome c oxidase assembly protein subunit 15
MTSSKALSRWIFSCAALVFLIMVVGAVTRLTESGLSIVEWKPVTGALPPLSEADWARAFELYQTSPQYQQVNAGMSLGDFKGIYFWEWLHRLIGRLIGIAYALPLAWFWYKKRVPAAARKPLLGILALGALQGAMGWYMVASGLVDRPAVSHYRLAAHLMLAVLIFCCLLRMGLRLSVPRAAGARALGSLRPWIRAATGLVAVTMVWGAFVAGLRAGVIYNDNFPLMGAHIWPGEIFYISPWWINFFENHATVQFTHRVLALLTTLSVLALAARGLFFNASRHLNVLFAALWGMVCVQVGLGITTLVTHVNIVAATLHQAGALAVLGLFMLLLHHTEET